MALSGPPLYDWLQDRGAGVLLHVSSLPSGTGIGNVGSGAYRFVDFLEAVGLSLWQICPLGPTGYGDSPYQCFSAFAGNPYFIDFAPLEDEGLVTADELGALRALPHERVDYGGVYERLLPLLRTAYDRFAATGATAFRDYGDIAGFRTRQEYWLEDYALFMALKEHFEGRCWIEWPPEFRNVASARGPNLPESVRAAAEAQVFYQYVFYAQLAGLRRYAGSKGIEIMGDAPIFVALDSADVWSHPELFQLKNDFSPKAVAGVPPDYFSETGQLWGNPLYDWKKCKETGFAWWLERIRGTLEFYDIVRLDHFRGFESYWSVPAGDTTAENGKWVKAPGLELFGAIRKQFPEAKLVAEDLGEITEAVRDLHAATGLPGMAVLHFAFGGDADNGFLPHNYGKNCIAYSGTHDNDTSVGWYRSVDERTRDHLRRYLSVSGEEVSWDLFRAAVRSSANLAVAPLQDLMSLGPEARLNRPGAPEGNWQWRYQPEQLEQLRRDSAAYLRDLLGLFGRL